MKFAYKNRVQLSVAKFGGLIFGLLFVGSFALKMTPGFAESLGVQKIYSQILILVRERTEAVAIGMRYHRPTPVVGNEVIVPWASGNSATDIWGVGQYRKKEPDPEKPWNEFPI